MKYIFFVLLIPAMSMAAETTRKSIVISAGNPGVNIPIANCSYVDSPETDKAVSPTVFKLLKCRDATNNSDQFACEGLVKCFAGELEIPIYFNVKCLVQNQKECLDATACVDGSYYDSFSIRNDGRVERVYQQGAPAEATR